MKVTYCFKSPLVSSFQRRVVYVESERESVALYLYLMSKYSTHESILEGSKNKGRTQHHLMGRPNSKSQGVIVGG